MNAAIPNLSPAAPEIFVLGMACLVLLVDLFLSDARRVVSFALALATLSGAAALTLANPHASPVYTFGDSYVADRLGDVLKMLTYVTGAVVFIYSSGYLRERGLFKGEYYLLGLFGILGIMVIISAHSFLTLYLGLELLSLSLYAMVAFDRDSPIAAEAAMKYFVLGALSSGALLYGISIVYGLTGSLDLAAVGTALQASEALSLPLLFALAFMLVGIAFKLGAVPFHMWLPDVYHGAPTPVTLYIGTASKIGAFALAIRILVEGMGGLHASWSDMLMALSVLSMAVGNVVAIAQTNLKRMLAYSTISHVGFILLGFVGGDAVGYRAALFYTVSYVLMAAGSFGMIVLLSRHGFEADRLEDFKGLNARSPWFAAIMLILMFGLAGVPPFLGFYAKIAVISAVLSAGMTWLAVLAVLFSVIGAFYYLRVIKLMYFDDAVDALPIEAGTFMRLTLSANGLAVLAFGLLPAWLIGICASAIP
jgi:NADH-quinone oxidoreductase subunit N